MQSKSVIETISLQNSKDFELKASVDCIDYYVNKDFVKELKKLYIIIIINKNKEVLYDNDL